MVLTRRVGTARPYGLVLLLYIVTFTVYGYYWWFKAHDELMRQFELDREGRQQGVVWLVMGVLFYPLIWVHIGYFVGNVAHIRRRMGMPKGISPETFIGKTVIGMILLFFSLIVAEVAVAVLGLEMLGAGATAGATALGVLGFIMAAAGVFLLVTSYAALQKDINEIWHAYDQRMQELLWQSPDAPDVPAAAPPVPSSSDTLAQPAQGTPVPRSGGDRFDDTQPPQ